MRGELHLLSRGCFAACSTSASDGAETDALVRRAGVRATPARLRCRIRLTAPPWGQDGAQRSYAIHAPQNHDRLQVAFREELERILRDGVTQEELYAALRRLIDLKQIVMVRAGDSSEARKKVAKR